jgi:hypothetical protein
MRTLFLFLQLMLCARADQAELSPSVAPSDPLFHFHVKSGEDAQTYRMIDNQNRIMDSGSRNAVSLQDSIVSGHARAKEMVDLLKNQELQHSFGQMSQRGKQMLQENSELKNPLSIIGGAVGLWIGRSVRLIKGDSFKLDTRVEGRARSGEFSMESPILNGKFSYRADGGLNMNLNRDIEPLAVKAEMNFNQHDQTLTGSLLHPLTPHLGLSFGATQYQQSNLTAGQASINYNLNF